MVHPAGPNLQRVVLVMVGLDTAPGSLYGFADLVADQGPHSTTEHARPTNE